MSWLNRLAQVQINPEDIGLNDPITDADAALGNALDAVYFWAGIVCVIIIVAAGFLYAANNANPQRIKRAREAIIYASIGLVIVLIAFAITRFVTGSFIG